MGIFSRKAKPVGQVEERSTQGLGLLFNKSYGESTDMKLSAVYCATNQISNSVAMLGVNIIKDENGDRKKIRHQLDGILNLKPDGIHTHFILFKQLIESVILKGNGYALIIRDDQLNVEKLVYLNPDYVTVLPQVNGPNKYSVAGFGTVDAVNMIHLYMHCDELGNGISLLQYAYYTIRGNADAEKQARNYFANGGSLNGILSAAQTLDREKVKQIRDSWQQAFSSDGAGIAVLGQGLTYSPISVNPADQQLLESREFGIMEIARFFCIPPSKLMVWDEVSYNALEYSQLVYLTDTIQPYVQMLKDEFSLKLFKPSQIGKLFVDFDFTSLLITDNQSKVKYYGDMVKNGLMSINEARTQLGMERIPEEIGGDSFYMQLSYTTLENIKNGALLKDKSQTQAVDNQVKQGE